MERFPDLKDSPIFHGLVIELAKAHESSLAKTKLLVDAGQRYARALETVYQTSLDFSDAVESFGEQCGSLGDNSGPAVIPQPTVSMSRLVQSMREVSSFVELLRTQVELIVCDGLGSWADEDHRRIQDATKVAKARKAEYDGARGKYVNKLGDERMATEEKRSMVKEQVREKRVASDVARLGLARALVESKTRFEIEMMTSIASVMHAQKKYFEHGCAVGGAVDPHGMYRSSLARPLMRPNWLTGSLGLRARSFASG
jgi:Arf-GAP with coiled-coil, ANK repeat and PH domain-containing protein